MINPLPSLDRTSPTFRTEVDLFFGTQLPDFSVEAEAARVEINTNTNTASDAASDAVDAAQTAQDAAEVAQAAANFKGLWASLTGGLNKPASVKHEGRFWYLLNNLADVTASEPDGSNPDWTVGTGGTITARVGVNTTMAAGVLYTVSAPGLTMTAPAGLLTGDTLEFMNTWDDRAFVDFGSYTVKGGTPDSPVIIPPFRGFKVTYDGVTLA